MNLEAKTNDQSLKLDIHALGMEKIAKTIEKMIKDKSSKMDRYSDCSISATAVSEEEVIKYISKQGNYLSNSLLDEEAIKMGVIWSKPYLIKRGIHIMDKEGVKYFYRGA